jgi:hypothetical protein
MITDEMTEEQMMKALTNAHSFELKVRANLLESLLIDLRDCGMTEAAEMIEANYPS